MPDRKLTPIPVPVTTSRPQRAGHGLPACQTPPSRHVRQPRRWQYHLWQAPRLIIRRRHELTLLAILGAAILAVLAGLGLAQQILDLDLPRLVIQ